MREEVIATLVAVLAAVLPLVRAYIKAKLTPERLQTVNNLARVAVQAAEKLGEAIPETTGDAKYDVAAKFLADAAKKLGLKLTPAEVFGYVHSALREMVQVEGQVFPIPAE